MKIKYEAKVSYKTTSSSPTTATKKTVTTDLKLAILVVLVRVDLVEDLLVRVADLQIGKRLLGFDGIVQVVAAVGRRRSLRVLRVGRLA